MFEEQLVAFEAGKGFSLVGADLIVDDEDYKGVHIAVEALTADFDKVTAQGRHRKVDRSARRSSNVCIIVGTLAKSSTIQSLEGAGKINVADIQGTWESWITACVEKPVDDYDCGLVIAGSDKRGAIFGAYSLSQQIGISPVKYRGIFINDEAPGMDTWFAEHFGPSNQFDTRVYKHIFELLLRLKANFLWPAMWRGYPQPGRSFFVDDPENQKTADDYGIVVGTSHHEPMQRAMNEWSANEPGGTWRWDTNREKITDYFDFGAERAVPYESYITMGMRAEGDGAIGSDDPIATLTDILKVQRGIIKDKYGENDGEMQLIALYNEVQRYYEQGLRIPDDMTLLFADDNNGSLRRLPTAEERKRKGGLGYYYHFQYTGGPRSYRWMNSNTLGKVWHQLRLGYDQGATQIWVFNVGDLKPQELPLSFAFDFAWDIDSIPADGFPSYFKKLAEREFGDKYAQRIADLWYGFERLIALRKHEQIEAETFSVLKYREAETIVGRWAELTKEAEAIHAEISSIQKPAFFQLVVHPIKASYIYNNLRMTQTKNRLCGKQRRNTTNPLLHECLRLFDADDVLTREYHSLLDGKWNHMLRQPHYGYGSHVIGPSRDMIDGLSWVRANADSNPSVGQMGVAVEGHTGVSPGIINEDVDRTHPSRLWLEPGVTLRPMSPYGPQDQYFEIFHRGTKGFTWEARPQYEWLTLTQYSGTLNPDDEDIRIHVTVDWKDVPDKFDEKIFIEIIGSVDGYEKVRMQVRKHQAPEGFTGFVQNDSYVSINPGKWVTAPYIQLPILGRQDGGSVTLPNSYDFSKPKAIPFLKYDMHTFTTGDNASVEIHFHMTLEADPNSKMQYDTRWDGGDVLTHRVTKDGSGSYPNGWTSAAQNYVWKNRHSIGKVKPGRHTFEIRFRSLNVAMEKIVLDLGGTEMKYLGPPESDHVSYVKQQSSPREEGLTEFSNLRIAIHM
ncbi:uncharacterized protein J7T54_003157 [Emericellopsis cladophorae]|uniref:Gylcosyl hydrolase 115 C-terminal domain-containing protein n=1 Tax=Emericellopsis cladophorae TaxID=2686198 RepID=A0A9P9Y0C7_9HYPO|nr:uncharacterized protein J7T54_003157 [Emericellopsis cladophorae]KAI6781015.1 hypothetical protein J7T54_003157 [Emericellopsis cladophorae]